MNKSLINIIALGIFQVGCFGSLYANEALVSAARSGDMAGLSSLLAEGVDPNYTLVDGSTALYWAAYEEQLPAANQLLAAGADPSLADRYGVTPLYLASMNGNTAIVSALLDSGADPDALAASGESMLMIAARTGVPSVISKLINAGAEVDKREEQFQQTALMVAVREGHIQAATLLLDAGADPNAATRLGEIPAFRPPCKGTGCGSEGVGINRGGLPDRGKRDAQRGRMSPLLYAARDGYLDIAALLIRAGADIEQAEANNISPLLMTLINGHMSLANLLLDQGADVNSDDFWGRSPLWAAVEYRNVDMNTKAEDKPVTNHVDREAVYPVIKRLLDLDADVNFRTRELPPNRRWLYALNDVSWVDYTGQTAFLRAAFSGDTEVMELLLDYGANPNVATFAGTTPLMAAAGVGWVVDQTYTVDMAHLLEAIDICISLGADVDAENSMGLTALLGAANRGANPLVEKLVSDYGADLFVADVHDRDAWRWAEGVFLASVGAEWKPHTLALLDELAAMQGRKRPAR